MIMILIIGLLVFLHMNYFLVFHLLQEKTKMKFLKIFYIKKSYLNLKMIKKIIKLLMKILLI